MTPLPISRRSLLLGGLGVAGLGGLAACTGPGTGMVMPGRSIPPAPSVSPAPGQNVVTAALTPRQTTLDLAGQTLQTWAYGDEVPGKLLRATAGDFLRVSVDNQLPADTTVHWHGIRLRNAADGVPGVTQNPIAPGAKYVYEFTAPDPGTYFFHPHVGVQLDRGLYAPLIIDDPHEPGGYDLEWVIVLDDWLDGTGTNPDEVLKKLIGDNGNQGGGMDGMGGMGHGGMGGMGGATPPWGDAGDIAYPYFLINGKPSADPFVLAGKPGQRVRMRVINAASAHGFSRPRPRPRGRRLDGPLPQHPPRGGGHDDRAVGVRVRKGQRHPHGAQPMKKALVPSNIIWTAKMTRIIPIRRSTATRALVPTTRCRKPEK